VLIDRFGRKIDYLRVSITDRCNFRCLYCYSIKKWKKLKHEDILRFEEILKVVKVGSELGIRRVRITGGEPLLRKNVEYFIKELKKISGIEDIGLTTNGYFLLEKAEALREAGLLRINISLDTLKKEKFERLTGVDGWERVWKGIQKALKLGFSPVKINAVIVRGFNDDEVVDLAKLTLDYPVEVRFIEFMPIGENSFWNEENVFLASEIKKRLEEVFPLEPAEKVGGGPARVFKWGRGIGKIGIISPISESFCEKCNRLRLTADGRLRPCLFSDFEINLKAIIRGEAKGSIEDAFFQAVEKKPERLELHPTERFMRAIGG